jgi:hypothetical protein
VVVSLVTKRLGLINRLTLMYFFFRIHFHLNTQVALLTEAAWVLCNATRRGDHGHIKDIVDNGYLDIVKWGLQPHQQRSLMIHTLKGLWCTLAMGSKNRRCTCNEYFSKVHVTGIEPLLRAVLENEEEKRVRQWCKVVTFMMDTSRTVIVKDTTEHVPYWRPDAHKLFCTDFRVGVKTLLLCKERIARTGGGGIGNMTRDNFETMFGLVGNGWFCVPEMLLEDQVERPSVRSKGKGKGKAKRKSKKGKKKRKGSDSSSDSDSESESDDGSKATSDSDADSADSNSDSDSDASSTSGSDSEASGSDSDSGSSAGDKSDSDDDSGNGSSSDSEKSDSDSDKSDSDSDSDDDGSSSSSKKKAGGGSDVDDMM